MIKQLNPSTESNSGTQPYQQNRIYDSEGEVPALSREKADLLIATNNSKGYEIANIGDSINYSVPSSKTRRGRESCIVETDSNCSTITGNVAKNSNAQPWIGETGSIRRLTPTECERLQGFPDNHTEFGNYDGVVKKIPKTQRYKLMGNAVTVDIVALVASRIKLI